MCAIMSVTDTASACTRTWTLCTRNISD